MAKDFIGYEALTDRALRGVVREALKRVQKQGLIGSHHFYLTFKTQDPGVEIPDFLKERYPDEITIVLQNQFSGLNVTEDSFEVTLSFQKLPARLFVPFAAMTGFADPSVQFGLQFKNATAAQGQGQGQPAAAPKDASKGSAAPSAVALPPAQAEKSSDKPANPQIVSLDKFRKK
ncbi:MAG TPA: ClpXP protease specificity-enhancing factor SspB [Micropepsaceae bacterium]|nr:ClpXP protease specificity-enhancing factor SspB [Micropepsaceae bacterium]